MPESAEGRSPESINFLACLIRGILITRGRPKRTSRFFAATAMTQEVEEGVASIDGMMEPEVLADCVVATIEKEEFLILPHREVLDYMRRKTSDYDRWLSGMRKLRDKYQR